MKNEIETQLEKINSDDFHQLVDFLIYGGAFSDITNGRCVMRSYGYNSEIGKSRKSNSKSDTEIESLGIKTEYSTEVGWLSKMKKDIKKIKNAETNFEKFVFATNREIKSEKIKSLTPSEFAKKELGCKDAYLLGFGEIIKPLYCPTFSYISRHFFNIKDNLFVDYKDYIKKIEEIDFLLKEEQTFSEDEFSKLEEKLTEIASISYIFHCADKDFGRLLLLFGELAKKIFIKEKEEKNEIKTPFSFLVWPNSNSQITIRNEEETKIGYIVIWDAGKISNLTDFERLKTPKNSLIFLCKDSDLQKVEKMIPEIKKYKFDFEDKEASLKEVQNHKIVVQEKVEKELEYIKINSLKYEALVYFYSPVYLNDEEIRTKIRNLLGLKKEEEKYMINFLIKSNNIIKIGELIRVKNIPICKKLFGDFIEQKVFAIDKLMS